MKHPDILKNSDGSVAVITRTSDGRLCIAEGTCVYTANAALRALVWSKSVTRLAKGGAA